jgi:hypothetical protein
LVQEVIFPKLYFKTVFGWNPFKLPSCFDMFLSHITRLFWLDTILFWFKSWNCQGNFGWLLLFHNIKQQNHSLIHIWPWNKFARLIRFQPTTKRPIRSILYISNPKCIYILFKISTLIVLVIHSSIIKE